jgi:hypothetical protein
MANTVSLLSYANTFGDWVVTTNAVAKENNDLAANNYHKTTGTLYLDDGSLGLQVANNVILGGQLQVVGLGSSAYIQNNLRVDQQVFLNNTAATIFASGPMFANGAATGLYVSNNALVSGSTLTLQNSVVAGNVIARAITANTAVQAPTISVSGTGYVDTLVANTTVNTQALNLFGSGQATGTLYVGLLQANTTVNSSAVYATNMYSTNFVASKNVVSTANVISDNVVANSTITAPTIYATSKLDANNAPISYFNNIVSAGQVLVGGNFVINGATVYSTNTFTLNAGSSVGLQSIYAVNRGSTGANAQIRWNENSLYWDIRDVNNPTSYSKILTANLISDSGASACSATIASSQALYNANTYLQSYIFGVAVPAYARANTSANAFVGTSGTVANPTAGAISYASTYGVTVGASGNQLLINTPQDLRSNATPTFAGLTLTAPLATSQGGTGATGATAALNNLLPAGQVAGYVLTTGGLGTYYWAAGGTGGGGGNSGSGTTINSSRSFPSVSQGQTVFTTPTYTVGASQLRVYIDGVRQYPSDYTETSNTSVTLSTGVQAGSSVMFEVDGYINNPIYANTVPFTAPFGSIAASANTVQLAIQDLESRKATLASPTFTGIQIGTTASTDTANTQLATTAFVKNALNSGNTFTHSITGTAGSVANTNITGVITSSQLAANLANLGLNNPTVTGYTETIVSLGNSGSTLTLSLANSSLQSVTLTAGCTFTMPTAVAGKSLMLFANTGTGGFTSTTFSGVRWASGLAPTFTSTANKVDIYSFVSDGTTWYGSYTQAY